jgi:hypothetical protein
LLLTARHWFDDDASLGSARPRDESVVADAS